jgi:hypothetical protein
MREIEDHFDRYRREECGPALLQCTVRCAWRSLLLLLHDPSPHYLSHSVIHAFTCRFYARVTRAAAGAPCCGRRPLLRATACLPSPSHSLPLTQRRSLATLNLFCPVRSSLLLAAVAYRLRPGCDVGRVR